MASANFSVYAKKWKSLTAVVFKDCFCYCKSFNIHYSIYKKSVEVDSYIYLHHIDLELCTIKFHELTYNIWLYLFFTIVFLFDNIQKPIWDNKLE